MQALVTGSTGFVGAHLVRTLVENGHTVRAYHRTTSRLTALEGVEYESALGDLTDLQSLRQACDGCDWVFHVAAVADYWRADKDWMFEINVEGTRKVLQAAKEAGVKRVVFTSSAATIGLREDGLPSDETMPFNLPPERFPYGYSKMLAEQVVQEAVADGQDIVTVNPVIIMGPADLNMISGVFILQISQSQWLTPYTSGGVSVIDVRDVAQGHLQAMEKGQTGERYILMTANYSNQEWFRLVAEIIGVAKPMLHVPDFILPPFAKIIELLRSVGISTPVDANQIRLGSKNIFFDGTKAHQELGTPQISMQKSVKDTFLWYQENGYIQDKLPSKIIKLVGRLFRFE